MRHLHALGRSLASSAIALLSTGLCAPAGAQPSYRASHDGAIAEFAPPRRESFDRLIVQLPPLVPVRRSEKATASPAAPSIAAAVAPAAPAVREAAPSVTPARVDAPEAKPAAAPTAPVEAAEAPVASAAASAVAVPAAPLAIEPAESHSAPDDAAVEAAPVAQAPEAPAAAAPEAPAAEEMKTEAAEAIAPSAEVASAPAAAPTPARLLETVQTDDQESGGLGWAALVIVALLALGGFVAVKRMKARREKAMSVAEPASRPAPVAPAAAAPAPRMSRVAGILGMARAKLGPAVRALLQRLRNRRGDAKADPAAEPQAAADWARIGATLRARANAPVDPVATPAAGATLPGDTTDTTAPRAEARRWEQDREDGVELLEPGSVGARSLVMNARRKLQAAGER